MIRRAVILVFVALAFPAVASASTPKQYVLKHPKREHCKAHYIQKVEHGKRWCVRVTPTGMSLAVTSLTGSETIVQGLLWWGGTEKTGKPLANQTIRYTITDETTGKPIGLFTGRSNAFCGVVTAQTGTTDTFTGGPVSTYPRCTFAAPVTAPSADTLSVVGSFVGKSTYAPSRSKQEAFG
jgi:hypothetical protein